MNLMSKGSARRRAYAFLDDGYPEAREYVDNYVPAEDPAEPGSLRKTLRAWLARLLERRGGAYRSPSPPADPEGTVRLAK